MKNKLANKNEVKSSDTSKPLIIRVKNSLSKKKVKKLIKIANKKEKIVVLPDIRSAHNIGSIFRTSEGSGIDKIYLSGQSPTPVDRFGRQRTDISKVSLGAELMIPWEYKKETVSLLRKLKKENYILCAVEQTKDSIDFRTLERDIKNKPKIAFIFGNEVQGLPKKILDICDIFVEIPMKGKKESLNVSVTAGIILFSVLS